jgi:hypothetical protein
MWHNYARILSETNLHLTGCYIRYVIDKGCRKLKKHDYWREAASNDIPIVISSSGKSNKWFKSWKNVRSMVLSVYFLSNGSRLTEQCQRASCLLPYPCMRFYHKDPKGKPTENNTVGLLFLCLMNHHSFWSRTIWRMITLSGRVIQGTYWGVWVQQPVWMWRWSETNFSPTVNSRQLARSQHRAYWAITAYPHQHGRTKNRTGL